MWVLLLTIVIAAPAQAHVPALFGPARVESGSPAAGVAPANDVDDRSCPKPGHFKADFCGAGASCRAMAAIVVLKIVPPATGRMDASAGAHGLTCGEIVPPLPPPRS